MKLVDSEGAQTRNFSSPRAVAAFLLFLLYGNFLIQHLFNEWNFPTVDFPSFYFAAISAFKDGISPYNYGHLAGYEAQIGQHIFPFFYPPFSLPLFYPLSVVPYEAARDAFLILNHLLVVASPLLTATLILGERKFSTLALAGVAIYLLSRPVAVTLLSGQVNLVVLFCLLVHWFAVKKDRPIVSGLALSCAILLKTYPAIFLLPLLLRKRWLDAVLAM